MCQEGDSIPDREAPALHPACILFITHAFLARRYQPHSKEEGGGHVDFRPQSSQVAADVLVHFLLGSSLMGWPCPSVSSSLLAQNALSLLVNSHESVPGQLLLCYDHFPMCTCRWRLTNNFGRHTPVKLGWVASEPQVSAALVLGQC